MIKSSLICLIAGTIITLALSPFDIYWLALISPCLLYIYTRKSSPIAAIWLGWCFGLGFFGAGVSWVFVSIYEHSATPFWLAILITFLFTASLGLLFSLQIYLWRKYFSDQFSHLSFIGLWVLFEWLRSWLFTGFPWLYLGSASLNTPLQNYLPIGGVWLASLMILLMAVALAKGITKQRYWLLVIPLPVIIGWLLPTIWTVPVSNPISVALVQPNIPQALKWNPQYRQSILETYIKLSLSQKDVDIIIWPETAIPAIFKNVKQELTPLLDELEQQHISLISGLPIVEPDKQFPSGYRIHNGIKILSSGNGTYYKQRLVPFGEYIPLLSYLRGIIDFFNLPMSNFSLPQQNQSLLEVQNHKLAPAICYEIAYPNLIRDMSRNADILLTISNDTWFGDSIAPAQHLQIARTRAVETGRWLIRDTNNGISAIVDPQGNIQSQLPQFTSDVLEGEVFSMQGLTPWQQYGSLPLLIIVTLFSILGSGITAKQ